MWKSVMMASAAAALIVAAALLPPLNDHAAKAQPAPLYITAVNFEINQQYYADFLKAIQDDGENSIQEPGVREFNITFPEQDPNHLFLFIVYDDYAAWDAHQKSAHYGKFIQTTTTMVKSYDFKVFSSVAMNMTGPASGRYVDTFVNATYSNVVPADFNKFIDAAKENAAAAVKDPGCREFDIVVAQQDPHLVLSFSVFYNASALSQYQASDHFKKFQAATATMVSHREEKKLRSLALFSKSR